VVVFPVAAAAAQQPRPKPLDVGHQRPEVVPVDLPRRDAAAAPALVEEDDGPVQVRVEEADVIRVASCARPTMQEEGDESPALEFVVRAVGR
jgi:hypothetical protein